MAEPVTWWSIASLLASPVLGYLGGWYREVHKERRDRSVRTRQSDFDEASSSVKILISQLNHWIADEEAAKRAYDRNESLVDVAIAEVFRVRALRIADLISEAGGAKIDREFRLRWYKTSLVQRPSFELPLIASARRQAAQRANVGDWFEAGERLRRASFWLEILAEHRRYPPRWEITDSADDDGNEDGEQPWDVGLANLIEDVRDRLEQVPAALELARRILLL